MHEDHSKGDRINQAFFDRANNIEIKVIVTAWSIDDDMRDKTEDLEDEENEELEEEKYNGDK